METAFTEIYAKKRWGEGSGSGSKMTPDNKEYISLLQSIINEKGIQSICDIGCGDWGFSQYINFAGVQYLGIDCVKSVIDDNKRKYEKENINFQHKSIDANYIPEGFDLIIVKDVIQHWEDDEILHYMDHIIKKNKYVFSTNGYKFMRDPVKNTILKRNINNPYRYHPVSLDKYPLCEFKQHSIMIKHRRAKQMVLFKYQV
tara:strand:- start:80 stop:682 length:603 start_codon:yes stop_codon:yes gene_type:complete